MSQIIANRNWAKAATVLQCEPSPDAIAEKLIELFPKITTGNKTQEHIIQELALGECELASKGGSIVRVVNLVTIKIENQGKLLIEAFQELHNGKRVDRRIIGVAEKAQTGETPEQAALRGIAEELEGISPQTLESTGFEFEPNSVSKYKGIQSYAAKYTFEAVLKPEDVRDRYEEFREGDRTVFVWAIPIYSPGGEGRLATKTEFEGSDGSLVSALALAGGDNVLLGDGVYQLDDNLRLIAIS